MRLVSRIMCGLIGYVGKKTAWPILLEGLRRLEYRGYDSAGVAVRGDSALAIRKKVGKLDEGIARLLQADPPPGTLGHARCTLRPQFPSAPGCLRPHRRGAQRRHRKLRPPQKQTAGRRSHLQIRHRHRSAGAFDWRLLPANQNPEDEPR